MKELQAPEPPQPMPRCISCRYWMRNHAKKVVITPQGQTVGEIKDLVANGTLGQVPADCLTATVAHCFVQNTWQTVSDNFFCGAHGPVDVV